MKRFNKVFAFFLILILSFVAAIGSAACDLSKFKFGKGGSSGNTGNGVVTDKDGENQDDGEGDKSPDENEKEKEDDETEESCLFPDYVTFYKYIDAFDDAQSSGKLDITSRETFAAYIDYVLFYGITEKVNLTIKYSATSFKDEYSAAKELYDSGVHLVIPCSMGIEYSGLKGSYFVTETAADTLATKTIDGEKNYVAEQVDYAFKMTAPRTRAEDYDDFKLNSAVKTLKNITNSEQLRWAIQNGYKPECVADSPAELALNNAKAVLREIISDDMDDVTKLRAMYEWLAFNVSYDRYAASEEVALLIEEKTINSSEFDSWYVEGVFNNRKAVCEGYAKALIVMAGLEGIPAVMVTGNGHAWNRVLIDGKWYVVDATHGDVHVGDQEVFTYSQFMITDAEKANRTYPTTDYPELSATTDFIVYENIRFDYLGNTCDLVIDSQLEMMALLTKAEESHNSEKDCTVNFFVKAQNAEFVDTWLSSPSVGVFYKAKTTPTVDINGNVYYVLFLR